MTTDDRKPMFPAMQSTEQLKKQVWNDAIETAAKAVSQSAVFSKQDRGPAIDGELIIAMGIIEANIRRLKMP